MLSNNALAFGLYSIFFASYTSDSQSFSPRHHFIHLIDTQIYNSEHI